MAASILEGVRAEVGQYVFYNFVYQDSQEFYLSTRQSFFFSRTW